MAYGHGKNDKMIIIGIGVALLFIAVVMLTTSTQSSSETITSVVNNPAIDLPNGGDGAQTVTVSNGVTEIIATEISTKKMQHLQEKPLEVDGFFVDEERKGDIVGSFNIEELPIIVWSDSTKTAGTKISGPYKEASIYIMIELVGFEEGNVKTWYAFNDGSYDQENKLRGSTEGLKIKYYLGQGEDMNVERIGIRTYYN